MPVQFKKTALNMLKIPSICVCLNRIAHPECKIRSSSIHLLVVLNLYDILSSVGNKCMERTYPFVFYKWKKLIHDMRVSKWEFILGELLVIFLFSHEKLSGCHVFCTHLVLRGDACLMLVDTILTSLGLFFILLQN